MYNTPVWEAHKWKSRIAPLASWRFRSVTDTGRWKSLFRGVEIAANFATIAVTALLSVVILRNHFVTVPAPRPAPARPNTMEFQQLVTAGTDLSKLLPGVSWERNGRTLVLALSTHWPLLHRKYAVFPAGEEKLRKGHDAHRSGARAGRGGGVLFKARGCAA
jgi:hypothetical protein